MSGHWFLKAIGIESQYFDDGCYILELMDI